MFGHSILIEINILKQSFVIYKTEYKKIFLNLI